MTLTWRFVLLLVSVAFFVAAAFGVGDGDPNLVYLGIAALIASYLDVGPRQPQP